MHKDISEILVSLHRPRRTFDETFEDVLTEEEEVAFEEKQSETIKEVFVEDHKCISKEESPILFQMFTGKQTILTRILNALFCELVNVLKKNNNSVDFSFANDKCGRAIIMPQAKTLSSFMEKARKLKWVESMLDHLAGDNCDKDDAAEWLCYYIGKRHDAAFTLASESLGYPLVQRMDEAAAEAMWADANINTTQQRIVKRHYFGKGIVIAEKKKHWSLIITLSLLLMDSINTIKMEINLRNLRSVHFGLAMLL